MRIIIYGVGAIGGTVAAGLVRSGQEVLGIARGARLKAIREQGLMFRTPDLAERVKLPCVEDPGEITFREGDAVMLAMKTQHTMGALERLRAAGWRDGPVFCAQNGVENERLAARVFPNVHGVVVLMPASYLADDEVNAFSTPLHGIFDIGRYPAGADDDDAAMVAAMARANIGGMVDEAVMAGKFGKLLLNLNNIVGAAFGPGEAAAPLREAMRREAEAVLAAAGVAWRDVSAADPRREQMKQADIAGVTRGWSSTTQSLARGAGSVETDYLNGEIALLGRQHGVPAPVNEAVSVLGASLAASATPPGQVDAAAFIETLRSAGAAI